MLRFELNRQKTSYVDTIGNYNFAIYSNGERNLTTYELPRSMQNAIIDYVDTAYDFGDNAPFERGLVSIQWGAITNYLKCGCEEYIKEKGILEALRKFASKHDRLDLLKYIESNELLNYTGN